jgi:hypothetical protein
MLLPRPAPETTGDVPVEGRINTTCSGAVAIVSRPAAQDGINLSKLLTKPAPGGVPPRELVKNMVQTFHVFANIRDIGNFISKASSLKGGFEY